MIAGLGNLPVSRSGVSLPRISHRAALGWRHIRPAVTAADTGCGRGEGKWMDCGRAGEKYKEGQL